MHATSLYCVLLLHQSVFRSKLNSACIPTAAIHINTSTVQSTICNGTGCFCMGPVLGKPYE